MFSFFNMSDSDYQPKVNKYFLASIYFIKPKKWILTINCGLFYDHCRDLSAVLAFRWVQSACSSHDFSQLERHPRRCAERCLTA